MERLKVFYKELNKFLRVDDFIYILQLEEYNTERYFRQIRRFFFRRNLQNRGTLTETAHVQIIRIAFWVVLIVVWQTIGGTRNLGLFGVILLIVMMVFVPVWVGLADIVTKPYYMYLTWQNELAASKLIRSKFGDMLVIAVTGSFGKTTTKNFIYELVRHSYKTQMIPGNINTSIGIANWINSNLQSGTQLLVVEMGAYVPGEIKSSCAIIPPDIAVIAAIADQHMERFGTFDKLVSAKKELFDFAKKDSKLGQTRRVIAKQYAKLVDSASYTLDIVDTTSVLSYLGSRVYTNLQSSSAIANLHLALKVGEVLNIPAEYVADTIQNLEHPERRQKLTDIQGYAVIDDSYNISATTAEAGLETAKALANTNRKKVVVITAGIPEVGTKSLEVNLNYGEVLAANCDYVVLLNSILAPDVASGLAKKGFNRVTKVDNMKKAWEFVTGYVDKDSTVVLMQPELNDLYY